MWCSGGGGGGRWGMGGHKWGFILTSLFSYGKTGKVVGFSSDKI